MYYNLEFNDVIPFDKWDKLNEKLQELFDTKSEKMDLYERVVFVYKLKQIYEERKKLYNDFKN